MNATAPGVRVVILAAGRSRRMGADKAALSVGDEPVLARLDRLASGVDPRPIHNLRPDQAHLAPAGREVLHDRWPERGPLGGIATALDAFPGHAILALAVDMPRIAATHLRALLDPWPAAPARCLAAGDRPAPLPSLWLPAGRDAVVAEIEAGRLAIHAALDLLGAEQVAVDASDLLNVNTPGDLEGTSPPLA